MSSDSTRAGSRPVSEQRKEGGRGVDRQGLVEPEKMAVARDNDGTGRHRQGDEVVVTRVRRPNQRWLGRVIDHPRLALNQSDRRCCIAGGNAATDLGVGKSSLQLGQEKRRCNQVIGTVQPGPQDLRRRPVRCQQGRDDDVGVEDRPHGSALGAPSVVLSLDGQLHSLSLLEVAASPQPVEEVQAKVAPDCRLDHRAVALPSAGRQHPHRTQHLLIDREGRASLRHIGILASLCADAQK